MYMYVWVHVCMLIVSICIYICLTLCMTLQSFYHHHDNVIKQYILNKTLVIYSVMYSFSFHYFRAPFRFINLGVEKLGQNIKKLEIVTGNDISL